MLPLDVGKKAKISFILMFNALLEAIVGEKWQKEEKSLQENKGNKSIFIGEKIV